MQQQQSNTSRRTLPSATKPGVGPQADAGHRLPLRQYDYYEQPMPTLGHPTVYESGPAFTGILNASGEPIYRPRGRLGFL